MAVNLSPVGGVAAQFFTSTGAVLTGGKLYTYAAGTTTPVVTYTSSQGNTAWTNPIVLDAAGRVSGSGEIWLTDGVIYKFVLKDSNDVLIATYDNITGINSNAVAYTNSQEIFTATAGQTVFTLTTAYSPGTNSLSVFVDGVNQYGSGAQYAYVETDQYTVTFNSGLHVGAEVKFTSTQQQGAGAVDSSQVTYDPPFTNSVATNVQAKLAQTVSVKDFGAVGDGVTDDSVAIQNAINSLSATGGQVILPVGRYKTSSTTINMVSNVSLIGQGQGSNGFSATNYGSVIVYSGSASAIKFENCVCSNLTNLTIDCSGTTGTSTVRGIFHNSSWLSVIENVFIFGVTPVKGYGILMTTGTNGSQHNDLRHIECADGEILFSGTNGNDQVTTTTMTTCRGLSYVASDAQITFINCTAEGFTNYGFYFQNTGNSKLIHCDIEGSGTAGIEIDPVSTHAVYVDSTIWVGYSGTNRVYRGKAASETTYGGSKYLTSEITTGTEFPELAWGNNPPNSYSDFLSLTPVCDNATGGAQEAHLRVYRRIAGAKKLTEEYKNFYRIETSSNVVANTPFTLVTLDLSSSGYGGRVKVQISGFQSGAGWFEVSRECVVINNLGTLAKTDGTPLAIQSGGSTGAITFTISGTDLLVQASHGSATPSQLYIAVEFDGRLNGYTKV